MKKIKNIFNFKLVIVYIIIISFIITGVTIAKYQNEIKNTSNATTANWLFKLSYNNTEMTTDYTIPLRDTITTQSTNVAANYIAPGVGGSILLKIDCTECEVGVDYTINITDPNNSLPSNLKFYKSADLTDSNLIPLGTNYTTKLTIDQIKEIQNNTIYWKWIAEDETTINANDLAKSGTDMNINISITGEQQIENNN